MRLVKISGAIVVTLVAMISWAALALFGGLSGWWMSSAISDNDSEAFAAYALETLEESNPGNAAFVLIEEGRVASEHFTRADRGIDAETVFPTASFSKWIAALGTLSLAKEGLIDLDDPVSQHISRWQLPEGPYTQDVTIRRLLSHTGGLSDGLGFGDYSADETIPSLEQSLRNPRASSGEQVVIDVEIEPGTEFIYSGGGYLILELLIEEVSGQSYAAFIQDRVLAPLGMDSSSFGYLGDIEAATAMYDEAGAVVPSYRYASAAATGFSSSAADLTLLVQAVLGGGSAFGLEATDIEAMRQPEAFVLGAGIWGLGTILYAPTGSGRDHVFGHDGANDPAVNVSVRINPETQDALIVLVNGQPTLASDIGAEWVLWQTGTPDFLSAEAAVQSAVLPIILGCGLIFVLGGGLLLRWALAR